MNWKNALVKDSRTDVEHGVLELSRITQRRSEFGLGYWAKCIKLRNVSWVGNRTLRGWTRRKMILHSAQSRQASKSSIRHLRTESVSYTSFLSASFLPNSLIAQKPSSRAPYPPHSHQTSYITTHGIGIQQQDESPHSKHFVFPAPDPLTMSETVELAALPGPFWLTREMVLEEDD